MLGRLREEAISWQLMRRRLGPCPIHRRGRARMRRTMIAAAAAALALAAPGVAGATGTGADASDPSVAQLEQAGRGGAPGQQAVSGAAGVGDPYFPLEGNGGYDVRTYDLSLALRASERPPGRARVDHR